MSVHRWAADLTQAVFETWEAELPNDKEGFKLFNSPIQQNPEVLTAGTNPGSSATRNLPRDHMVRFQNGNFAPPDRHEFITKDYDLAEEFSEGLFADRTDHIEQTVHTNRYFIHRQSEDDLEPGLETFNEFCEEKFLEIIERLSPELVLCHSLKSYNFLKQEYGFETVERILRTEPDRSGKYLLRISDHELPQVLWVVHPSSKHHDDLNDKEWATVRDEVYARVDFD